MEEGKKMWQVAYNPEEKTFEASTGFACQEAWDEAELIGGEWFVVVEADNKADAMQLGYNMIRAAICRQEAALKDVAKPEFEKAKAEQEQGPKWWDVCYSVHTKQYSVREAPFTLTGPQKDGEIDDDKGCYHIYVQAPNEKTACIEANFKIGQYILKIQTGMAYAVRRIQREYFFNNDKTKGDFDGDKCCGSHAWGTTSSTIVGWNEPCEINNEEESQWKL